MAVQVADPAMDGCVLALHRAGLELREQAEEGNGKAFLLQGNTFANKELLKRYGGRWSRTQQAWVFESLEPIRDLASALPATGEPPSSGLADAPAAFEAETPSFVKLRKRAQNSGHRRAGTRATRARQRMDKSGPRRPAGTARPHVVRGGSRYGAVDGARCISGNRSIPGYSINHFGFRVVCSSSIEGF
jgi:hypothetical protein